MHTAIWAVLFTTAATAASAGNWDCVMTSECLDTEACTETAFEFSLGALNDSFLYSDIAGERPMSEIDVLDTPDQRAFVSQVQAGMVGLLSLYPDGQAQYSLHSADFSVRYSGSCEVRG